MKKKIIISTGGTGGHVFPAISIARTFLKNDYDVLVTTDERGKKFFVNSDINYKVINSGYSIKSIKSIFNIIKGIIQSIFLIKKNKPVAVVGFGCYATLPVLIANKLFKTPIFLHEGNVFVGRINNLFIKDAVNIFTTFQEMYGVNIKYCDKISFAGIVVRDDIKQYSNNIYKYPTEGKFNILITGGSGGASFFSNDFIRVFEFISKNLKEKIKIIHQVKGEQEVEKIKEFYKEQNITAEVQPFFTDMPQKMLESDLIICRSGIGTIGEVSFIGRPCIMIPSPNVVNNHQLHNAKFYLKSNACILIEEKTFIAKSFAEEFEKLLSNKDKMEELAKNIKSMSTLDSNDKIFNTINEYVINKEM